MEPRTHRRLHLAAAFVWVILAIPTVLWWKESILWVALMSVYAIVIAHLAAYNGARSEEANGS